MRSEVTDPTMTDPTATPTPAAGGTPDPAHEHAAGDAHHADAHDGATGHDAPGHHDDPLGPIDWRAWGAGVLGVALGLGVAVVFGLTTGLLGG